MNPTELKDAIIEILKEKNAQDITIIDVAKKTEIADYMVIVTGRNSTHVRVLGESLEEKMEEKGVCVLRKEGLREKRWVVLDYASVIVHIFNKEMRGYVALEQLWGDGENVTKIEE